VRRVKIVIFCTKVTQIVCFSRRYNVSSLCDDVFDTLLVVKVIVTKERPLSRAVQSDGTQTGGRTVTVRRDLTSLPR